LFKVDNNDIDIVIECTGAFRTKEKAQPHIDQGAKKVLLSAPAKDDQFRTIVLGVNDEMLLPEDIFVSNASCTTNGLAPIVKVLHENFGIESGIMTTIHSYTADQQLVDAPHKDLRRGRAAAVNIVPTTTGAAKAIGKIIPELAGKLNGCAMRVPTQCGSLVDLVVNLKQDVTAEQVNAAVKAAAEGALAGVLRYEEDPIVLTDIIGDPASSIFDALSTMVINGSMVKIVSWYDNEWGYSNRCVDLFRMMAQ